MLIILFGLSGAGKSHTGQLLSKHAGYFFWDADQNIPFDMQEAIKNNLTFTSEMRNTQTEYVIAQITHLLPQTPNLAVALALYKEPNRKAIQKKFPDAQFVYITASDEVLAERIITRANHVDIHYASQIRKGFEPPQLPHFVLENNDNEQTLLASIQAFLRNSEKK